MGFLGGLFGREGGSDPREAEARKMQAEKIVGNIMENIEVPGDKQKAIKQKLEVAVNSQLSMGMNEEAAAEQATRILEKELGDVTAGTEQAEGSRLQESSREALQELIADSKNEGAMQKFILNLAREEGMELGEIEEMKGLAAGFIENYSQYLPQDPNDEAQLDRFIDAVKKQIQVRRGQKKAA